MVGSQSTDEGPPEQSDPWFVVPDDRGDRTGLWSVDGGTDQESPGDPEVRD